MHGLITKNTGSWYLVHTDDGQDIECKIKGNFRLKGIRSTNPVAVGDRAEIIVNTEGTAFISQIDDRKNYIIRKASNLSKQSHILAANVDQCLLIVTINYPETSTTFIDRFLASAEAYRVPVKLVFNKIDLYNEDEQHYLDGLINLYTTIGYPCFTISALQRDGIDALKEELHQAGQSGASEGGGDSALLELLRGIYEELNDIICQWRSDMQSLEDSISDIQRVFVAYVKIDVKSLQPQERARLENVLKDHDPKVIFEDIGAYLDAGQNALAMTKEKLKTFRNALQP